MLINGKVKNEQVLLAFVPGEVKELIKAKIRFVLTGSRYFGDWGEFSDWDFVTADTAEARNWLTDHGFVMLYDPLYTADPNTAVVYQKGRAHIQLARSFDLKMKVQNFLGRYIPGMGLSRWQKARVWRMVTELMTGE